MILSWRQYMKENKKRMYEQLSVDQRLQTQKKEVNAEQQGDINKLFDVGLSLGVENGSRILFLGI